MSHLGKKEGEETCACSHIQYFQTLAGSQGTFKDLLPDCSFLFVKAIYSVCVGGRPEIPVVCNNVLAVDKYSSRLTLRK
jgi:hypothetical protein